MFDFILAQNKFRYCDSNPLEQVVMVSPVWTDFAKFPPPFAQIKNVLVIYSGFIKYFLRSRSYRDFLNAIGKSFIVVNGHTSGHTDCNRLNTYFGK